jgi:hypothetical protein
MNCLPADSKKKCRSKVSRKSVFLLCIVFSASAPAAAENGNCGFQLVTIKGTAVEVEQSCAALAKVLQTFAAIGFRIDPEFRLIFKDQVFVERLDQAGQLDALRVLGFFDSRRSLIEMTSFQSSHQEERRPWGVIWGPEIAGSILHHELAHMATFAVLGDGYWRTDPSWLEFIAYSIEFEVMDPSLRAQILANNPSAEAFEGVLKVNPMLHGADPDRFGLRSYLMTRDKGGLEFIRRVLAGEVDFSTSDIVWRR